MIKGFLRLAFYSPFPLYNVALFKDNDILHQVLCWGVRDMKHYLLLPVDSPLVEVECGGVIQHSQHIEDTRKNPNFPDPLIHFEVVSVIQLAIHIIIA